MNPFTHPSNLAFLSTEGDWRVRYYVANPSGCPSHLERLSVDGFIAVRGKVAQNPSTPSDILALLSKDENS